MTAVTQHAAALADTLSETMTHDLTQPITILHGDAIAMLRELPAESVQCVITSPPYYGLRAYNTVPLVWGGEPSCEHVWGPALRTPWANEAPGPNGRRKNGAASHTKTKETGPFCQTCSAVKCELGQEPTVQLYIEHLTMVFREVWRVLAPSGTCWVNIADSYAGAGCASGEGTHHRDPQYPNSGSFVGRRQTATKLGGGLKNKDLCLVPERLAIALQDFGWYLRASIVWAKECPMPESVTDRVTRSHEMVYMLTKNERYYYDAAAIAEPASNGERFHGGYDKPGVGNRTTARNGRQKGVATLKTRNSRDVWTITPEPFVAARLGIVDSDHFATMPPKLAERCILAGSRSGDLVCDPFGGSGTVGMVARRLERRAVLIELNPDYVAMAERRCMQANLWREGVLA